MGVEEVARLLDIPEDRVSLIKRLGLDDPKVKGKLSGLLSKRVAVEPRGRNFTVILSEGYIEDVSADLEKDFSVATKLGGRAVVDGSGGKVYSEEGGVKIEVSGSKVRAVAPLESGELLIKKLRSAGVSDSVIATVSELVKGRFVISRLIKGVKIYVEGGKVYFVLSDGKGVEIEPDETADWKELYAGLVATLVKEGYLRKEDLKSVPDDAVRKRARFILEKGFFPL